MAQPPTTNNNNNLSAFDQITPLPTLTMTPNNVHDVFRKNKQRDTSNTGLTEAQVSKIYVSMRMLNDQLWNNPYHTLTVPQVNDIYKSMRVLKDQLRTTPYHTWQSDCGFYVLADAAAALQGSAAAAAKTPPLVRVAGEEEVQTAMQECHLRSGNGVLNGDANQKPLASPDAGANVKKAPYHSQRSARGGLNGCNLFKQHKKYCIVKCEDLTLDDFIQNLFDHAKEVRRRSVCKSTRIDCDLAGAGAGRTNAHLLNMWKDLSDEQRHEYNARASEIKANATVVLRRTH